nr:MAG TPA: hypothetical protein [Caudoviricetes sp.]
MSSIRTKMIRTDRKYNQKKADDRTARIAAMEQERDELVDRMFDHPELCTEENIRRVNYLSSQVEIMRGKMIYNVNINY